MELKGGRIAGLRKTSLSDWEGRVAAVVFISGCPWRCPFCQNPGLLNEIPGIPFAEIRETLQSARKWIDGIVVTGGEPLFREDIIGVLESFRELGLGVKLDTGGFSPGLLERVLDRELAEYVALDIKTALRKDRYRTATGSAGALEGVLMSIDILEKSGREYEFRTTLVPGVADPEDLFYNAGKLPGGARWALQRYRPENAAEPWMRSLSPLGEEEAEGISARLECAGFRVLKRGYG